MDTPFKALEVTGTIDERHQLRLDEPLSLVGPQRVRVIILMEQEEDASEREWLHTAAANPAFDFLKDPKEDVYARSDGKPFQDEG